MGVGLLAFLHFNPLFPPMCNEHTHTHAHTHTLTHTYTATVILRALTCLDKGPEKGAFSRVLGVVGIISISMY